MCTIAKFPWIRRGALALLLLVSATSCSFAAESSPPMEGYDPQYTILSLNMAVMSVYRITTEEDRIILDQEYSNIINNFSYGDVKDDDELVSLYQKLLFSLSESTLRTEGTKRFEKAYQRQLDKGLMDALGGIRAYGGSPWSVLLSGIVSVGSAYFNYQGMKAQYAAELDNQLWELEKDRVRELNSLRSLLLKYSWKLLQKYSFPDRYRLSEATIQSYLDALADTDVERSLRKFKRIKDANELQVFPPFWLEYGRRAQSVGNEELALRCYSEFETVNRPILRKDFYAAEMAKNRIVLLMNAEHANGQNGLQSFGSERQSANAEKIAEYLELLEKNSTDAQWTNFLFSGIQWYLLGRINRALEAIQRNIDNEYDVEFHRMLLSRMRERRNLTEDDLRVVLDMKRRTPSKDLAQLRQDAEQGYPNAQFTLGWLYYTGVLVDAMDYNRAFLYFSRAAEQGHLLGETRRAILMIRGLGCTKDEEKGNSIVRERFNELLQLAEKGDPVAQVSAGLIYGEGYGGIPVTPSQAIAWYRKAAESGEPTAQRNLALNYLDGTGLPKDEKMAAEWMSKAAESGKINAQYDLGLMYLNGEGVPKDKEKGQMWLQRAADRGFEEAQKALKKKWWKFWLW